MISIIIPVYNSEATILRLTQCVFKELEDLDPEIILVNDCSKDNSEEVCERLSRENIRVKFISLRKNAGEHNAVICGLNHCSGEYAAIIDDDFQNPPEEIRKLYDAAVKNRYDVVYSYYNSKKHHFLRNLGSSFNNIIAAWLLKKPINLYLSSFKLINKEMVREIIKYQGPFPYIDGLILRSTSNIGKVEVQHNKRQEGKSNYTLSKLISLYSNMFFNFSIKPIRVCTYFGLLLFFLSLLLSIWVFLETIILQKTPPGWAFTTIFVLFFNGAELLFLGLIGEYLGKMFLAQNGTPQYSIKFKNNLDDR